MTKEYLLCLLVLANCFISDAQLLQKSFHTGVECAGSITCISPFCYLNRFTSSNNLKININTGCTLLRPLYKIYVQQVTKKRFGLYQNYRPIISYPPYEWCKIMEDAKSNPIYKFIVQLVSNSVPSLFHICPYWGPVNAFNLTLNMDKIFSLFQPGDYLNSLIIFDDIDHQIFKIKIYTTVT